MSDPINEIISMSNDDSITKDAIVEEEKTSEMTSDGEEEEVTDDEDEKKEKKKIKKYTESPKKKEHKINKKKLGRELRNNKLRQIKVSLPYTVKSDRFIDYNKSEEVVKSVNQEAHQTQGTKITPFYEKTWFKVIGLILIAIFCAIVIMFITIKIYKHHLESKHLESQPQSNERKQISHPESPSEETSPNYDKLIDNIGVGIKGGKKNTQPVKKNMMKRDSRGRFVSQKQNK